MRLAVNTRILSSPITGVQRYLSSILDHLPVSDQEITQLSSSLHGVRGHIWEQFLLPMRLDGSLLWSPSNAGPLLVKNQILTLHDAVPLDHPEWLNVLFAKWYRFLLPVLASRVHRIVTVSHFTKERIVSRLKVPDEKISVVHNGVDSRFRPLSEDVVSNAREWLGLSGKRYILALGSIEPRKNLQRLIRAWSEIVNDVPRDIWLVVSGAKGAARIFGDVALRSLPSRVKFTGHVPDGLLPAIYSGAMLTAYASLYEGFGLPVLEAMACGSPVLTSDRTALPEVAGGAALLVNPYDIHSISQGLYRLIADETLRSELGRKGEERSKEFTWKRAALQMFRIFEEEGAAV